MGWELVGSLFSELPFCSTESVRKMYPCKEIRFVKLNCYSEEGQLSPELNMLFNSGLLNLECHPLPTLSMLKKAKELIM